MFPAKIWSRRGAENAGLENRKPILHCFYDTATNWLKIANFFIPFSFSALERNDPVVPVRISGRTLEILLAKSF